MGRIVFSAIAFLVVAGVFIGIGVLIGGGWGAAEAGEDAAVLVSKCIQAHGGSITQEQFASCVDQARQGG